MKKMNKFIFLSLSFAIALFFIACGDDDSASNTDNSGEVIGPDGKVIPDSILYSDSLYTWYLEQLAQGKSPLDDSTKAKSSSSARKDSATASSSSVSSSSSSLSAQEQALIEAAKVHLLPPAGFYSELTIPVPAALYGGKIYCTFDGTMPTMESQEFVEPYEVTRNTPVRCAEFAGDTVARQSSHTFFIGESVSMPVVAISVDPAFFRNNYVFEERCEGDNPKYCTPGLMAEVEYPVHVEFFEKGSASAKKAWQIDAGISLMGGWSRTYQKKSVSIKMRSIYEDGRLKYNLFDTRPEDNKFKGFNLRNGGNRYVGDFVADPALTSLAEGTSVDYQRSRMVVVFYNGVYYGIHDLRERLNEHFVETNYGIDSKQVDMVKHIQDSVIVTGGSADSYIQMLDFIAANDFNTDSVSAAELKTVNANYLQLQTKLDVGSFADYLALEMYIHNGDWPDNNVRAWRAEGQPYKYMIFDVDHGFGWEWGVSGFYTSTHNMFKWIQQGGQHKCNGNRCLSGMYLKLIKNADFRRMFINHGAVMLTSYLTAERVNDAVDKINAQISESEMDRDLNTMRRMYSPYGSGTASFDRTGAYVKSYATTRTATVRSEYRSEFGLGKDISVTIASSGKGRVLLDGMELPSDKYTGTFFEGNDMMLTAVPEAGRIFDHWEEDGNKDNPRMVSPANGDAFTAIFK
jgi:hypothetical protein